MTVEQVDINAKAMERYRRRVTIELTIDNALHVTLNGVHTVNNIEALAAAVFTIAERNRPLRSIIGPLRGGVSYREFLEQAMRNLGDEIS